MAKMIASRVLFLPPICTIDQEQAPGYELMTSGKSSLKENCNGGELSFTADPDWNRWILSHHVSFLLWVLSVEEMKAVTLCDPGVPERIDRLARYATAYGAMLRYARLIGPENYARSIRPFMSQFFPGFSATWSADYQVYKQHVLRLIRSADPNLSVSLKGAFMASVHDHLDTARQLVPHGPSLLQGIKESHEKLESRCEVKTFVYDSLFLVSRSSVSRDDLTAQLRYRLSLLRIDPILATGTSVCEEILNDVRRVIQIVSVAPKYQLEEKACIINPVSSRHSTNA